MSAKVETPFIKQLSLPDNRLLAYLLDDAPEGAPVVLLSNPLCTNIAVWDHIVPVLNHAGFRTLRYDQPGHGDSSAPADLTTTTFDSMVEDVAYMLDALEIPRLWAWVGVSMGAAKGVFFATSHPGVVGRLVVCDTIACSPANAGVEDPFGPRVASARAEGGMEGNTQATLQRWFGDAWLEGHPKEAERMRRVVMRTSVDGMETCCNALASETFDLRPLLRRVGGAVDEAVCVVGEKDANLPRTMGDMRAQIEDGFREAGKTGEVELVVIPDAGHVCFVDGLEDFVRLVPRFIQAEKK
ncbi:unnamed protein product [Clonostachys solani]|uniref:AB hydrolase-1 domain-containing protein n=1 Tax=Clonostachys solani TaxID=160281 RepID=A0A9P0ERY5_9HYPO|nr:unnamed protein product [Clonostachys solani]